MEEYEEYIDRVRRVLEQTIADRNRYRDALVYIAAECSCSVERCCTATVAARTTSLAPRSRRRRETGP